MIELFVYGTLRRGGRAHHLLSGAQLVASVKTLPRYTLVSFGWFPGLVEGGDTAVLGEVYRVAPSRSRALDEYEGDWFHRAEVALEGGRPAITYFVSGDRADGKPRIGSGDFFEWMKS